MNELKNAPHLSGYQARDLEVIDYQMSDLATTNLKFRGPIPEDLTRNTFFSCIGAAQTLGCFVDSPFPNLVSNEIGLNTLNLGYGGAGPEFFNQQDELIDIINQGCFLVVQAMSGRSQSNSAFDAGGLEFGTFKPTGEHTGAAEAWQRLLLGSSAIRALPLGRFSRGMARRLAQPRLKTLVRETRENWVESYRILFEKITVPTILVWFSKRTPDYPESFSSQTRLFGEFPHLINKATLAQIEPFADYYVESITRRGSPQPLFSRHTGLPTIVDPLNDRPDLSNLSDGKTWTHNKYYPSPEMHEDVARSLIPICREILG